MAGGGAERIASLLCNRWAHEGHDVRLIPTFSQRGTVAYPLAERVELRFLSDQVGANASRISRLRGLRQQVRDWEPGVIISFLPHVNVAAIAAASGTAVPVIVSERIHPPLMALPLGYRIQRRIVYPFADTIVAQTETTASWLRARSGGAPVIVIPNPVDYPLVAAEPIVDPARFVAPAQKLLLWAGRLDPQKRPDIMIDSFAQMASAFPDWDLAMIGEGALRAELELRIAAHGLSSRIHLPGFAGNLGDWYARADIYVMTSAFEGFPNTLLEAMAHGVACVAFDVPTGPAELGQSGGRLCLLPDHDHVPVLSAELAKLMRNPRSRELLAQGGLAVRDDYALPVIAARWTDAMEEAIARKHQRRGKKHSS